MSSVQRRTAEVSDGVHVVAGGRSAPLLDAEPWALRRALWSRFAGMVCLIFRPRRFARLLGVSTHCRPTAASARSVGDHSVPARSNRVLVHPRPVESIERIASTTSPSSFSCSRTAATIHS